MARFLLTAEMRLRPPSRGEIRAIRASIEAALRDIRLDIELDSRPATDALDRVDSATKRVESSAYKMGKAFAVSIKRFAAFSVATRLVGLFTRGLHEAIGESIAFERELIKVSQVTGKSMEQLRGLTDEITRLSTTLGVSSKSLISVSRTLAQAGLSARDTKVALDALAKSDLAPTFENIAQTAEGAVAVLNQFGQGAEALEAQLGAINAVAGQFAVEAGDLISVIRRTGGVFKAAGGDLNELIAIFTSVRSTTRESAESIATGLRTIFTRIQRPKTIEFLKRFGVELQDLNGKFVGPYEAVRRLSTALQGLDPKDVRFVEIAEQLGGFRQIGKVIPMLQQFAISQEALNVAMEGSGSLSEDAATAQGALAVRITKLKEEFMALVRAVTESPTFQIMANTALQLASTLIKVADALKHLLPIILAIAAVKMFRGIGGFASGLAGGLGGGRPSSVGMAAGGLVPGTGDRDTVPAVLTPGEFVIRKSSVNKIGAGTLAQMNQNRFAVGGLAKNHTGTIGMVIPDLLPQDEANPAAAGIKTGSTGSIPLTGKTSATKGAGSNVLAAKPTGGSSLYAKYVGRGKLKTPEFESLAKKAAGFATGKNSWNFNTVAEGVTADEFTGWKAAADVAIREGVRESAKSWAASIGVKGLKPKIKQSYVDNFPGGFVGSLFEGVIDAFQGKPLTGATGAGNLPFDYTRGLKPFGTLYGEMARKKIKYIDAKVAGGDNIGQPEFRKKAKNQLALDLQTKSNLPTLATQAINANKSQRVAAAAPKRASVVTAAAGGAIGAGSDTVPALLTPGEFVVNRRSAQSIGYGTLSKMNRYAAGGKVGAHRSAYGAGAPPGLMDVLGGGDITFSEEFMKMMQKLTKEGGSATDVINKLGEEMKEMGFSADKTTKAQNKFNKQLRDGKKPFEALSKSNKKLNKELRRLKASVAAARTAHAADKKKSDAMKGMGKMMAFEAMLGFATSAMGDMEGAAATVAKEFMSVASMAVMIVFALEQFGLKLTGAGILEKFPKLGEVSSGVMAKLAGVGIAATALVYAFGQAMMKLAAEKTKKKIEEGDVAGAGAARDEESAVGAATALGVGLTILTTVILGVLVVFTTLTAAVALPIVIIVALVSALGIFLASTEWGVKAFNALRDAASFLTGGLIESSETARKRAELEAANNKLSMERKKTAEALTKVMKDLEAGTTSAVEALRNRELGMEMEAAGVAAKKQAELTQSKKSDPGGARDWWAGGWGWAGAQTSQEMNRGIDEEDKADTEKAQANLIKAAAALEPIFNKAAREIALSQGASGEASFMQMAKDEMGTGFDELSAENQAKVMKKLQENYQNINKALEENRKRLKALNFGFRSVQGAVGLASVRVGNFVSSLEPGAIALQSSVNLLEAALNDASIVLTDAEMDKALKDVTDAMHSFGADPAISKIFGDTIKGFNIIGLEFENVMKDMISEMNTKGEFASPEEFNDMLKERLKTMLGGKIDDKAIEKILATTKMSPEQVSRLQGGDMSVLAEVNKELREATLKQLDIAKQINDLNKQLIKLTQKKIEAERNSIQMRQQEIDIQLEAKEIVAKHGGPAVTPSMRRRAIIDKANVRGGRLGLTGMGGGSPAELRRRNQEIRGGFGRLEGRGRVAHGFGGQRGAQDFAVRDDLVKEQQEQVKTIKDLIKADQEHLKVIQKKTEVERKSLEALLKGDLQNFLKGQASSGATAAIAAGGANLAGLFGAEALGGAFQNIRKQQKSGVSELFGQRIGGGGGLLENSARLSLGARGIRSDSAAQTLAGTTPEENKLNRRIRESAEALGEAAGVGADMAQMQIQTADMNIGTATLQIRNAVTEATNRSRGGLIYASHGVFVPRGTDTVPAMLTPGEFVVRREAVQSGGNLQMLKAMNGAGGAKGYAHGGVVQYFGNGSADVVKGAGGSVALDAVVVDNLSKSLTKFNTDLTANIAKLDRMSFNVKLDPTSVTVNLTGASFMADLKQSIKEDLMEHVGRAIKEQGTNDAGEVSFDRSVLKHGV